MPLGSYSEEVIDEEEDDVIGEEENNALPILQKGRKKNQVMTAAVQIPPDYQPPVFAKDEDTRAWLKDVLAVNKIFRGLSPSDHEMLIGAFQERSFAQGETIIQQGDPGDNFYVVESGECDISVQGQGSVMKATKGLAFGELALLQNAPRAATVTAETIVKAWSIDMLSFRAILMCKSQDDASMYSAVLESIPLLKPLSPAEKGEMAASMREVEYAAGEPIIVEGDEGSTFYIIRDGEVKCTKTASGEVEVSRRLLAGDFFGELALISNEARAATVTCVRKTTVLLIDRTAFERLLGSVEAIKMAIDRQSRK